MEVFVKEEDLQCLVLFLLSVAWVWKEPKQEKCRKRMPQNTILLLWSVPHLKQYETDPVRPEWPNPFGYTVLFSSPLEYGCCIYCHECVFLGLFIIVLERDKITFQGNTRHDESLSLSPSFWVCFYLFQCIFVNLFGLFVNLFNCFYSLEQFGSNFQGVFISFVL